MVSNLKLPRKKTREEDGQAPTIEELLTTITEQQRVIQSDGGTEFADSADFRLTCNAHYYDIQTTGLLDISSQREKGERPNKTLVEKTKCLYYIPPPWGSNFGAQQLSRHVKYTIEHTI